MAVLTNLAGATAIVLATGGFFLRRRISKNWITKAQVNSAAQTLGNDQTIVITGGNTGLGLATAKELAAYECKIILTCRNMESGEEAVSQIKQSTGNEHVSCIQLDLSSLESVSDFCKALKERKEMIYALICNAGVWVPPEGNNSRAPQKTKDGFEIHFGVNHVGHFALLQQMIPYLKAQPTESRIVMVSSSLAKLGKIDIQKRDFIYEGRSLGPDDEKKKSFAPLAYCDTKLMNMLTTKELKSQLEDTNVSAYAVSPGFCRSKLGRHVRIPFYQKIILAPLMRLVQRSPEQGAWNIVYPVLTEKTKLESGCMYQDGTIWDDGSKLLESMKDDNLQRELWNLTEELIKEKEGER